MKSLILFEYNVIRLYKIFTQFSTLRQNDSSFSDLIFCVAIEYL